MATARKKILVVDDEADITSGLKTVLEEAGFEVFTAPNGNEALKLSRQEKPDLIILDVMMPEMSGLQFVEAIRYARMDTGFVPIIAISARASMGNFFSSSDVVGFFSKPFKTDEILKKVIETIGPPDQKKPQKKEPAPWTNILKKGFSGKGDEGEFAEFPDARPQRKTPALAKAIVIGVEETLLYKIRKHLEALDCSAREALDETEALGQAREEAPDVIFCQYWGDTDILDAAEVEKTLRQEFPGFIIAVFCEPRWVLDAARKFGTDHIIAYENEADLFKRISLFIGLHFKRKADK